MTPLLLAALAAALFGVRYWFGPVTVYHTQRYPMTTPLRRLTAEEEKAIAGPVREVLVSAIAGLKAVGFARPTPFRMDEGRVSGLGILMEHPADGVLASVVVLAVHAKVQVLSIFETEWDDGFRVLTSNSRTPTIFPTSPAIDAMTFPTKRAPADLYAVHRARVERMRRAAPRRTLSRGDDPVAVESRRQRANRERNVRAGYLRQDGEIARPTVFGAAVMSWKLLPPWRGRIERRRDECAARTLHDLGLAD